MTGVEKTGVEGLVPLIEAFARSNASALAPGWAAELAGADLGEGPEALRELCKQLGWAPPRALQGRPRADQLPLLLWSPAHGWAIADQWRSDDLLAVQGAAEPVLAYDDALLFFGVAFPDPLRSDGAERADRAIDVFWRAVMRRKSVLASAALATMVANVMTLGTSLYSMQLFDRVIPLGSLSTLWVLTVGTVFALLIDLLMRSVRALMIEREAAAIDAEVSEYFFARAQAVRLDARPPGIGTMAAQLKGLEQVRAVMSSGSLFLIADLPFALFFIAVIFMLGGSLALVPMISLPIALAIAFGLSRALRDGTARAQIGSNRKNGLLVEALDASETIKATRGGWQMLGRWNRLVREVNHHEDPVKRINAIAASVFGTLQQLAYVALMAAGAIAVAEGRLTAGGLLACSIIAGRINGPLISMLPNFIVQWGYARSALEALDRIMQLPLDSTSGKGALRPAGLSGPLRLDGVKFAYPQARAAIDIPQLAFQPGERVAIIGGVGSGKSTLLRLAAGLYAPGEGSLRLGGLEIGQIADDILRDHIGYMPQDYRLVNGTLRDNLLAGLNNISDEALLQAARQTGLAAMIASHPMGLELGIAEGGRGLSGGQRSLVGMTRLLLARPQVMLLDEPTASLDQPTEAAVMAAVLRQLTPSHIFVLVTHRLQLLSAVQRVLVMAQGRIILDGPTAEVMAKLNTRPQAGRAVAPVPAAAS
jgi:ATP-binding cassette subfamily C protein LapB